MIRYWGQRFPNAELALRRNLLEFSINGAPGCWKRYAGRENSR